MFKHSFEKRFNMIEIIISMSIMVVVIVSVLSLVPKALWSNQEAVSSIAAGDTADQFLNYFASRLENNWVDLEAIPEAKYVGEPQSNPDGTSGLSDETDMIFSAYGMMASSSSRLNIFYEAPSATSDWDPLVSNKGVFKVQLTSASNQVDFEGYMRVWRTTSDMASGLSSPKHVTLHTEINWPTSLPYEKRRKKIYDLQIFQPGSAVKESSAIASAPCRSVWGIEGASPTLYYYTLPNEEDLDPTVVSKEGDIKGLEGAKIESIACAPTGNIFFVNNDSSEESCALYKVPRGSIDGDSSTDVTVVRVGYTGISNSGSERITSLQFINNKLFGLTYSSQECYEINYYDGSATKVADLNTGQSSFTVGGMTIGVDGYVYIARQKSSRSELWRFDSFPSGTVSEVVTINGSGPIKSISGHPGGWVYMYDGSTCYRVEPFSTTVQSYINFPSNMEDMDFYYLHESNDCSNERACHFDGILTGDVSLNPTGTSDYTFVMTLANGSTVTRDDLLSWGSTYEYEGKVLRIDFKPKSTGTQELTLDGEPFTMNNTLYYSLYSDVPFSVHLYNKTESSGTSTAIGRWYLDLVDAPLQINFCDDSGGNVVGGDGVGSTIIQVINGAIIPARASTVSFQVAAVNHKSGNTDLPVTLNFNIAGVTYSPFGNIGDPTNSINGRTPSYSCPDEIPAGSGIIPKAMEFDNSGNVTGEASSSPSTSQILILVDGNKAPNGSTVSLADNEALLYFELSTTDPNRMDYDTIILKVTVNPL